MNKNKKIISASLALALGVSLIIPNAKANEDKTVEKALKEPVQTSETSKPEEKSDVVNAKITIKKAPVNEGEEKPEDGEEKPVEGTEKPADEEEKPADGEEKPVEGTEKPEDGEEKPVEGTEKPEDETEKPDGNTENPKTNEEKPKDEKKVKPKEFKMSEVYKNKDSFEVIKTWIMYSYRESLGFEQTPENEKNLKAGLDRIGKAKNLEELMKATKRDKAFLAKVYLFAKDKITFDELYSDLVKVIDDTANQKPQNPNQKNPNRKNKKTGTTNTANKVSNAGENVQTGVGSLSAILGLLGASSLGLFKSKRK
ncbi:MAG: peptidase [Anaerococcus vaginalis]|uniref:peptidase n=1 Tax=Anaerococcus vaginalis TaxID=33037 RepID=UPI00290CBD5E|nr:peptidase [Anaerococcus vaginalis]MDU7649922.1 peptidase [Anaerococcus vaginalis]MDU7686312.1 peptidase [Bacillota bacterium]